MARETLRHQQGVPPARAAFPRKQRGQRGVPRPGRTPPERVQYPYTSSPGTLPKCSASLVTSASLDSSAVAAIHRSLSPRRPPEARNAREISP